MVVSDEESAMCGERLELLAVVRGLEALDGPARVTLVTKSRYVSRGLRFGMTEWRANDWQWERFGRVVPVKDCDLWQRVDRALLFHQVQCQAWQFEADAAEEFESCPAAPRADAPPAAAICTESMEKTCQALPVARPIERRLALTKRNLAPAAKGRKLRLGSQNRGLRASLKTTLATKAASLREALQNLVDSQQNLTSGAA
jgi:hypothetical protein